MTTTRPLGPADPAQVGLYRLTRLLGEGGQGAVYLGVDPSGGQVAIKLLHARLAQDADNRRRFLREVEAARRVGAFGTARVLDVDLHGNQPYIVSEYIPGESLQQLISREGPRDAGGTRRLMLATAAALKAIHDAGIVHRDFKPSNVLLGPDGTRVIDFGIARALEGTTMQSSAVVGTPPYMSPEQLRGDVVGPESDVFSWAVTMVFAATGRPAFGQDSMPAVFNRILHHPPELDGVPPELRGLLAACLVKEARQRPTAGELVRLTVGDHVPPPQQRAPARQAPSTAVRKPERPFVAAFVAQALVTLAIAAVFLITGQGALTGLATLAMGGAAALILRLAARNRRR
ncbi:serine/threonine-protein kinase [Nonomuraea sediminis]|uniref:serine/threonine-protein kinase n=1 Tax=Nonomuraea sediminis TaxID=2835864 RepID=UPI001BDDAD90|nr:serine/threonine-protein kinase [Nonomuraea sediminis]